MLAVRIHSHGGPDVLQVEDVPVPEPGPGQARVKLAAAGINFIDIYYRLGQYKAVLPMTLGSEGAGVVDALGPGVSDLRVGDRVASQGFTGGYAQYAIAPADRLVKIPEGVDLPTAAAAMLQGMTAHYLAHSCYPLKAGDTALVHAAAGGVGRLLVQIAKMRGARVIATVGTDEKAALARGDGADDVILYSRQDFEEETKRLTGGRGVDVVYDSVGRATFDKSLNCLRPRGYLVLFGQSSGPVAPVDPQILNAKGSLFLTRPTLAHYVASREDLLQRANDVLGWIRDGRLKVNIGRTYPLQQAGEAQRALAARETTGKVLLIPPQD